MSNVQAILAAMVLVCLAIVFMTLAIERHKQKTPSADAYLRFLNRVTLRVYSNHQVIIGPLSLTDLAMIVRYGGYQGQPEQSIMHIPSPGIIHPVFDITVEVEGTEVY